LLLSDTRVMLRGAKLGEEIARNLGRRDAEFVKRRAEAVGRNGGSVAGEGKKLPKSTMTRKTGDEESRR